MLVIRRKLARTLGLYLLLLTCLAQGADAQYKTERHRELGVTIQRPRKFDPIPTQPTEEWIKLYYKEQLPDRSKKGQKWRRATPTLFLVVIPRVQTVTPADSEPAEPSTKPKDKPQPEREEDGKDEDEDEEEEKEKPPIINFSTYLTNKWEDFSLKLLGDGKSRKGYSTSQYFLLGPDSGGRSSFEWQGYAYVFEGSARTVALMGLCADSDYEEMEKLWRKVGEKLKLEEPEVSTVKLSTGERGSKWERHYRSKRYSHPEYRAKVRDAVVGKWKVEDTKNYIFVFNTKDQPLLRKLKKDIELLRKEYMRRFPPVDPDFDAVSTVRICGDKAEYMAYGGSGRSAGYWNYVTEELVLYDAEVHEKGQRPDDSDTFIVLYHEAFHQYVHYSTGELPPHSWFNEGYGDFFSGARIKNGKLRDIGVNPWRIRSIQAILRGDKRYARGRKEPKAWLSWEKMTALSKEDYYKHGGANYAQGWSMVYFLSTAKIVAKHDRWSSILPTYFETLKDAYATELALLDDPEDKADKKSAGEAAREVAREEAFNGVDFREIEFAWREYISDLEVD